MEVTIKLEDYLTSAEIKEECRNAIRSCISRIFNKESEINRLISNLGYEFVFKAVSEAIGQDAESLISEQVSNICQNQSSIQYLLWRRKDAWEHTQSPAIDILDQAIKDNEPAIRQRVSETISNYDFPDVRESMYDIACEEIRNKLFGED